MKLGILFNGLVAAALAVPIVRFLSVLDHARTRERLPLLGASRAGQRISGRRDAAGHFPQSLRDADRRQDRGHGLLGAAHRRRAIPGLCDQLRAPGLSGPLVSAIRFVHVPVPRRSVLPRRLACLGSAGARAFRISVQSCRTVWSRFRPASCPRRERARLSSERNRHAPDRPDWRMVRPALAARRADSRSRGASACRETPRAGGTFSAAPR